MYLRRQLLRFLPVSYTHLDVYKRQGRTGAHTGHAARAGRFIKNDFSIFVLDTMVWTGTYAALASHTQFRCVEDFFMLAFGLRVGAPPAV